MTDISSSKPDIAVESVPLPPVSQQHELKYSYTFHVVRRKGKAKTTPGAPQPAPAQPSSWADNIEEIGSFSTVEQFWSFYNHLLRPSELLNNDYHLFRKGIVPMWEDEANCNGGKFVVRSTKKKKVADRYWEEMILAIIGEQFEHSEDLCGIVISCRAQDDVLSIWNRTSSNPEIIESIKEKIRQVLALPATYTIDYKAHNQSLAESAAPPQAAAATQPQSAPVAAGTAQ